MNHSEEHHPSSSGYSSGEQPEGRHGHLLPPVLVSELSPSPVASPKHSPGSRSTSSSTPPSPPTLALPPPDPLFFSAAEMVRQSADDAVSAALSEQGDSTESSGDESPDECPCRDTDVYVLFGSKGSLKAYSLTRASGVISLASLMLSVTTLPGGGPFSSCRQLESKRS